ncbi:hypothetical protein AMJ85_04850 [candidate division BRC1 bacterium SM23_51]|nr:MAG: hypothetical protein AMJ85_04850 [candidate division BRC1 bacterium SM23_51]
MKRREFFAASAVAGLGLGTGAVPSRASISPGKQLLELRLYDFESAAKQKAFDDFLAEAAIPALNRVGIEPVGVFKMLKADNPKLKMEADSPNLYVLLPHNSPESFIMMIDRLANDGEFLEAGAAVLEAPQSDPAYARYESSLMLAFDGVPKVAVPTKADSRVMQLRIYESHNVERALMKIAMFNEGGELEIFRRCGMKPVFFGQSLIGSKLPNLTYMLSFEDKEAMDKGWAAFRSDPGWLQLRNDETYKDTVSNVTNLIVRPAASSQI